MVQKCIVYKTKKISEKSGITQLHSHMLAHMNSLTASGLSRFSRTGMNPVTNTEFRIVGNSNKLVH